MLSAARGALVAASLIAEDDPLPPFAARMSGNLTLLVYPDARSFYVVKVGVMLDLAREHEGLARGSEAMPGSVPRPLTLAECEGLQVLVATGIDHRPLDPRARADDAELLVSGLDEFWTIGASAPRTTQSIGAQAHDALDRLGRRVPAFDAQRYRASLEVRLPQLRAIAQHGDFALNNLGRTRDGLAIFDWEDYGRVSVAGYDLATLLLSLAGFDARRLARALGSDSLEAAIARRACERLGMTTTALVELLPLYLALFIEAKSSNAYGPEVAGRAIDALASLARSR